MKNLELFVINPGATFLEKERNRLLLLGILFSCLLELARVLYTGKPAYLFLVWNLILAFFPFLISSMLDTERRPAINKIRFLLFFLLWLLFIPNAFYILTDLYHLKDGRRDPRVPGWFDLALIVSFAWNGLALGILSVRQMEKIIRSHIVRIPEALFIFPLMWLNALGVYIGRYKRLNSWDLLANPFAVIRGIVGLLIHPLASRYALGMIGCFSILFTLFYFSIKKMAGNLR